MRFCIETPKKRIASDDFRGHADDIEMSGERCSVIVRYGANEDNIYFAEKKCIFPMFRFQPDETRSSYHVTDTESPVQFGEAETLERVEIDGVLTVKTRAGGCRIVHRFYPSVTLAATYETVEIENCGKTLETLRFTPYKRLETRLGCEGYIVAERRLTEAFCDNCGDKATLRIGAKDLAAGASDAGARENCSAVKNCKNGQNAPCILGHGADRVAEKTIDFQPGEKLQLTFCFSARFANVVAPYEENPLKRRRGRVKELMTECDVTTGDDVVDTLFAFSKLRAGESIFCTRKGRVHSPGGGQYYAAVWCNDECEYATPWFAFTDDAAEQDAAKTAMHWWAPYMNDRDLPIPSSLISEGTDYWNGAGDRGDASMFLYGSSRYFLTRGELPAEEAKAQLAWCADYIERRIASDGTVLSDTDELENRLSSGDANLSTSAISYGAFGVYGVLLSRMGEKVEAEKCAALQRKIADGIEKTFGARLTGEDCYRYHAGLDEVRAWICLPPYMGIKSRADGALNAIGRLLWENGSLKTTENENVVWDRSALYYIAALFRAGRADEAWARLKETAATRLLGERAPYVVEAYPENGMRHLSGESALFCRIITDGLLDVGFTEEGFTLSPHLPAALSRVEVKDIFLCGGRRSFTVDKTGTKEQKG